ncbi:hypothetical protein ACPPVU_00090 [Mucilaginibacter sp. McL0603]|uniref:hypothetical protein n=1 Tax=Mucilaginibacter sp. McL0603 TaxID=3415670 RepID=UPI003CF82F1C
MRSLYILLLVALPTVVFAQTNFHQGYVVKTNGDTVKGYIDYREWSESPISVDFKATKDDQQTQQFDPTTARGFGVNGMETYITYTGLISNDLNHFPNLAPKLDTSKIQASIFLRLVTAGSHLSLYSQADGRKFRYFVTEANGTPVELKYTQYYNEQHQSVERAFFRGQLIVYINQYTPGNTKLIDEAGTIAFEQDQIEKIVYKINGDTVARANGHIEKSRFRWFLGGSFSYAQEKYESGVFNAIPRINFGFDAFDNPNVQQWVFRVTAGLSYINAKTSYYTSTGAVAIATFDQASFSIGPQILYNLYNRDNIKVFVGGGANLNFSAYSSDPTYVNGYKLVDPGVFWYNLPITAGVAVNKKFEVAFSYAPYERTLSMRFFDIGAKFYLDK